MSRVPFRAVAAVGIFLAVVAGAALAVVARSGPAGVRVRPAAPAADRPYDELASQVELLGGEVAAQERFVEELAPVVLAGRLTGVGVLMLSTPSGLSYVDGVGRMLMRVGANVTGRVAVTTKFADPRYTDELLDLAHAALPPSVTGGLLTDGDGVGASAALLSAVLLAGPAAVAELDRRSVLASYESQGYLTGTGDVTRPADVVVVLSGQTGGGPDGAVLALVTQLDRWGHVVVATAEGGSASDGVVSRVRSDPLLRHTISTVDNIGTVRGRLVATWAAADQAKDRTGHYGVGAGAASLPGPLTPSPPP